MFRDLVRSGLRSLGLYAFRIKTMPRGIALAIDLPRIFRTEPTVIFDVGANVGQTSLFFLSIFKGAEIFAFEPVRSTFDQLLHNTRIAKKIRPQNIALGHRDGEATMHLGEQSGWSRVVEEATGDKFKTRQRTEKIKMARLDSFCAQEGITKIDILKTDCEGFDMEVLQGAEGMINNKAIDAVYSEVNFRRDGANGDFFAIESFLSKRGFFFYGLYDYSGWEYDVSQAGFTNALFVSRRLAGRA